MFAWGFLCASLAIVADLALTLVVHFLGDSSFAAVFFIVTAAGSVLLGLAGTIPSALFVIPALFHLCVETDNGDEVANRVASLEGRDG